jgi:hypothetical protein
VCDIKNDSGNFLKTAPYYRCAVWAIRDLSLDKAPKEDRYDRTFRNKSELPDDDPWRNHPDATAEGWCKIPVIIAKQLRTAIDCIVPNTLMKQSDLTNSNLLEMGIYLDNAIREEKLDV